MPSGDSRVGTKFGRYQITGALGKGGMGEVYEAYDSEIGRTVALKIIKREYADSHEYRTRFEHESHAAAMLQEPHVIPIHRFGEIDGFLFIDMRLVRGDDLDSLLEKGPLEPSRAVAIIAQIAAALDAAHTEGLIHRDVKPQNIIVTPADFAYLVDFGIAYMVGDTRLTGFGAHIGSLSYMAPERFTGETLTPAVDVYALTCVLYECLTGQMPFRVNSGEAAIAAHTSMPPPRPSVTNPRVPPAFDEVIARGMAKDPDDRYGSAGALARAANKALRVATRAVPDPMESLPTQPASWPPMPQPQPQPGWPGFPSGPLPVGPGERRSDRARWLVPAVIAIAAALVLAVVGIVIGLLAKLNSAQTPSAAPVTPMTFPEAVPSENSSSSMSPLPMPSRPGAPKIPPIVAGPDQTVSHTSCDQGYQLPNETGFGTHAGRGTPATSCYFAHTVLVAYWNAFGDASSAARTVSAPGAVDCVTVPGASCDPMNSANFLMRCRGDGFNPWIKCTGGSDAVVYLW